MARDGLRLALCAGLLLAAPRPCPAQPGDGPEGNKILAQLAVQRALDEGRAQLKRGNFPAAVAVLEGQVSRINGSHEYLDALRDAYRGYVRELRRAGRAAEASRYQDRLDTLDPPAPPAGKGVAPAAAAGAKPAAGLPGPAPAPSAARGKVDDGAGDPFSDRNARPAPAARALLERAQREWADRHYEAARLLYEQVARAEPALLDCWTGAGTAGPTASCAASPTR
jgi:hypothetical protein